MPRKSLLDKEDALSGVPSPPPFDPASGLGLNLNIDNPKICAWLTELLPPIEAARELNTTPNALATQRCRGGGPAYIKSGGKVDYRRIDLLAYKQAGRVER